VATDAIDTKLAAARTRLILDKPFLGALVLRLPMKAANGEWCKTTATDARHLYYNPDYIQQLTPAQTQFMLAHEALHCALLHFARRGHRVKHRWDLACDFAINPLLVEDGLTPPPDSLWLDEYRGMTAEEIYPLLEEHEDLQTLDQHLYDQEGESGRQDDSGGSLPPPKGKSQQQHGDGAAPPGAETRHESGSGAGRQPREASQDDVDDGDGEQQRPASSSATAVPGDGAEPSPPPLTPDEKEILGVQWQQRTAGAAQQAMQAGKFGGALARIIEQHLQPQLPWRMVLARYLTSLARDDFSYMRPSRREGDAIYPSLRSAQLDVVVAVDSSGSLREEELGEFIAEIDALKGQIRARVTLLACDAALADESPWTFEPWEDFKLPESIKGGGGTDFRPVFAWVDSMEMRPELLLYFTDAAGKFPPLPPDYAVIWLVKGRGAVPWGERIQLN
jgi:predicted metal-dependent peptidase